METMKKLKKAQVGNTWYATWEDAIGYYFAWYIGNEPPVNWEDLPCDENALDVQGISLSQAEWERNYEMIDVLSMQSFVQEKDLAIEIEDAICNLR